MICGIHSDVMLMRSCRYDVVDTTEDVDRDVAEALLDEDDFELI